MVTDFQNEIKWIYTSICPNTKDVVKRFTLVHVCNGLKKIFKTAKTFLGSSTVSEQISKSIYLKEQNW